MAPRMYVANRELFVRLGLTAATVWLVTRFSWEPVCVLLATVVAALGRAMGVPVVHDAPTLVTVDGHLVQMAVSCTLIHMYFALIPVLWHRRRTVAWNVGLVSVLAVWMAAWAVLRVMGGLVGVHHGLPWALSHEVLCGITDFAFFLIPAWLQPWAPIERAPAPQLA